MRAVDGERVGGGVVEHDLVRDVEDRAPGGVERRKGDEGGARDVEGGGGGGGGAVVAVVAVEHDVERRGGGRAVERRIS